jgi:NADH-quinone oxidoreductase subunit C
MEASEIKKRLEELLGVELAWQCGEKQTGDGWITLPPEKWTAAGRLARDDEKLGFEFLRALSGVDRPGEKAIELVAHLFSYRHRHALVLKTRVPRENPVAESLCGVWPAAEWYEREIFDLLGVNFTGHPDLRRILLPEDWPGHPLRQDYQQPASYRGIPTSRPAPEGSAS